MSLPTEIDFALVKMGDGGSPENFTLLCGIQDATINQAANTTDRFVRDCTKPGAVPKRKVKVNGMQLDVTGQGLTNADMIPAFDAALGKHKTYQVECYSDNGTDAGDLLGTYEATFVMTANNKNLTREGAASAEVALASDGDWTFDPA